MPPTAQHYIALFFHVLIRASGGQGIRRGVHTAGRTVSSTVSSTALLHRAVSATAFELSTYCIITLARVMHKNVSEARPT
jgi:phosphate/sulfate permease